MKLWQIASGDYGRDYSSVFLRHDVMLIGPGDPGPYLAERYARDPMRQQIKRFVSGPRPGDIILLRRGHRVLAAGRIPHEDGGYSWQEAFDDVLGWDLQHTHRVVWTEAASSVVEPLQPVFGNYKQQKTFTAVHEERLTRLTRDLDKLIEERSLHDLPVVDQPMKDEFVGVELFAAGLSNDSVERVLLAVRRIRRLREWYHTKHSGVRPSEEEAITHMVVPLMTALGWSEQLMAIEWRNIDLALFSQTPTTEQNCVIVCEAKSPGSGLDEAFRQAQRYVTKLGLINCRRVLTTDGARLYTYSTTDGEWAENPSGYVNLSKIRHRQVFPAGVSGVETIISLVPWRATE